MSGRCKHCGQPLSSSKSIGRPREVCHGGCRLAQTREPPGPSLLHRVCSLLTAPPGPLVRLGRTILP